MQANEFAAIRAASGLTIEKLRVWLRVADEKTVRRYEKGERPIPGPIEHLMEILKVAGPISRDDVRLMTILLKREFEKDAATP